MNWKISCLLGFSLWLSMPIWSQMDKYDYKRRINGVNDRWHSIVLPTTLHEKVNSNLSDIRIYGITAEKDTIEAPYLIRITKADRQTASVDFQLLNTTHNANGHYFTFAPTSSTAVNQMDLVFNQENFDWLVRLEGSQDQQNWFTIKDDYRIIAIRNELTDYQFSTINFPTAKYKYYRLHVKTNQKVSLKKANLDLQNATKAVYHDFPIIQQKIAIDKKQKTTILEVELARPVFVSFLNFKVEEKFDFYRSMVIEYLADSTKTEQGWRYHYRTLQRTVLSSLESYEFSFESKRAKKLRISIQNQDNSPLSIDSIMVKGYEYQLLTRFVEPATYYLTYGQKNSPAPRYDIKQFEQTIPKQLIPLTVGAEQEIPKVSPPKTKPLFENEWWLWGIMLVIIGILGWFTLKMLQEKS